MIKFSFNANVKCGGNEELGFKAFIQVISIK